VCERMIEAKRGTPRERERDAHVFLPPRHTSLAPSTPLSIPKYLTFRSWEAPGPGQYQTREIVSGTPLALLLPISLTPLLSLLLPLLCLLPTYYFEKTNRYGNQLQDSEKNPSWTAYGVLLTRQSTSKNPTCTATRATLKTATPLEKRAQYGASTTFSIIKS
jgi:hypothetical protein